MTMLCSFKTCMKCLGLIIAQELYGGEITTFAARSQPDGCYGTAVIINIGNVCGRHDTLDRLCNSGMDSASLTVLTMESCIYAVGRFS
jgi:hypothetical protein